MTETEPGRWRLALAPEGFEAVVIDTGRELLAVALVWRGVLLAVVDEPAGEA